MLKYICYVASRMCPLSESRLRLELELTMLFKLLDIVYREETLLNVMRSVTRNGRSILLTAVLALVLVYMFSIVGYMFFRDHFLVNVDRLDDDDDPRYEPDGCADDGASKYLKETEQCRRSSRFVSVGGELRERSCDSLIMCIVTTLNQGLRNGGGIGDILRAPASFVCSPAPCMMNNTMNQKCKVCGEPAAGFHFGAFTCEGCKSFFGRSYNNLNSITECKNNGECVINKKNRTACKACRLRKCLMVGMSKSGSRYGRRSNWFKIHCLLQEQQQAAQSQSPPRVPSSPHHPLAPPFPPHLFPGLARPRTKEELALLGLDDYKPPCSASPDSHKSGSSPKLDEKSRLTQSRPPDRPLTPPRDNFHPLHLANIASLPHFPHSPFLPPPPFSPFAHNHPLLFPPGFHPIYSRHLLDHAALRQAAENNNDVRIDDHNERTESSKRFFLDEILKQQRSTQPTPQEDVISEAEFVPTPPAERRTSESPLQENPMDLSVKSDGRSSSARRRSDDSEVIVPDNDDGESGSGAGSASEEEDVSYSQIKRIKLHPLDLTTKV